MNINMGDDSMLELSPFLKDALREIGNIASCHAITALAEMTGMTIDINVPTVEVVTIGDVEIAEYSRRFRSCSPENRT